MRVVKVFNNNVVLGVDGQGAEAVLLGRGIGFQTGPGEAVDEQRIERRFVAGFTTSERLAALASEIRLEEVDAVEAVVDLARARLGRDIADHIVIPLADHVHFAIERARRDAQIEYPLVWEVEYLYPAEVEVGRAALEVIEERLGVRLQPTEAIPFALHLVNAQVGGGGMEATVRMTQGIAATLEIVGSELGVQLDERSAPVVRFVAHLRYLFVRQRDGQSPVGAGDSLGAAVRAAKPREYSTAQRVAGRLHEMFGWEITEDEVLYLALHVTRLSARPDRPAGQSA